MKLISWNINCRSGRGSIPNLVVDELRKINADVICLTEFVKGNNYTTFIDELNTLGYEVFTDPRTTEYVGNEILIAIKKEYAIETDVFTICNNNNNPNFLHVVSKINGQNHHFIGTRIKVGGKDINTDFINRKTQLCSLMNEIRKIEDEPSILLGDFNNGWYTENDKKDSYAGKPRQFYSYPLVVEEMESIGYQVDTPKNFSWGNGFKLDHVFTNKLVEVNSTLYDWDFKKHSEYKHSVGYPDHAMLLVTLTV